MPPVTAERSPPDSRITGADSPVIADSSTDAMPSTISPSPGISSPADTMTTSSRTEVRGRTRSSPPSSVSRRATRSARVLRSDSAWALPRPSAIASAKFANRTVNHSPKAIAASNAIGPRLGRVDHQTDRDDGRHDLHDEHHRVADQRARVELANAVHDRGPHDRGSNSGRARTVGVLSTCGGAATAIRTALPAGARRSDPAPAPAGTSARR